MTRSRWRRMDLAQPVAALVLAVFGVMTIYSAGADWRRQLVWLALGAVAFGAAAWFDYRRLARLAPALYAAIILLLLAVHLVGRSSLRARRLLVGSGVPLQTSHVSPLLLLC